MESLIITNLAKTFNCSGPTPPQVIFDDFFLEIKHNTIVAIIGPNGCGKTTLLNCIAGLTPHDQGNIKINAKNNKVGFIFQNYRESLLPWLTNLDNIACAIERPFGSKREKHLYIKSWAHELNITLPWPAYPYQCSGGEQQLLALAREFINQPGLLLMDEPFAALDYEKCLAWRQQIEALWNKSPTTIVLISHDIEEAAYLADEVIVLGGRPAKIFGRHQINLPRPRTFNMLQSEAFSVCHREVLRDFLKATSLL